MADQGIFINFEPAIIGPVKLANHDNWIECYNANWSAAAHQANVGASAATSKMVRQKVEYQDISVTAKGGKHTAEVLNHFFGATPFTKVTIDMVTLGADDTGNEVQIIANQLVLYEAYLTSFQDSMTEGDDSRIFTITLSFTKLDYTVNGKEAADKKIAHFDRLNTRKSS